MLGFLSKRPNKVYPNLEATPDETKQRLTITGNEQAKAVLAAELA